MLLKKSNLPHGALPFHELKTADFEPAFETALAQSRSNVDAIRKATNAATFENTIEALEFASEPLDTVSAVFSNYLSMQTSPELDALAEKINPKLSQFSDEILADDAIFNRVEAVYSNKDKLKLSGEQKMLLENTYRDFVRNGARLDAATKKKLMDLNTQLVLLTEKFKTNVLSSVNAFEHYVSDVNTLKGLSERSIAYAAELAKKKSKPGQWLLTMQQHQYIDVMTYSENRELREKIWRAFNTRAVGGENDNRLLLLEIAKLRHERAKMLGYETHAHYVTEKRMAKNPKTVEAFLERLAEKYREAAVVELKAVRDFAGHDLEPWDMAYYSEKLREKLYDYNEEELRPYFALENAIKGAFFAAEKRYNIKFKLRTDLPTWDEHVRVYEVDDHDGKFVSLFYLDPFPRESKRQGAWMSGFRDAGLFGGEMRRPHIINVGNFTPPTGNEPALLSIDDVTTLFHELGHALHGMLSKTNYRSLAGTNVAWDFVELPSQINENWATEDEVLDHYAFHYKTNERIPKELVKKVQKAQQFQAGLMGLRQVSLAMLDLAWHTEDLSKLKTASDVTQFEINALVPFRLLERAKEAQVSPSFSHIFAGGYSAGYYSYKWADVLAADAFNLFKAAGIFDQAVSRRFREEILERGGSEEAMDLYRRFRQGEPDPDALLRKEGLIS